MKKATLGIGVIGLGTGRRYLEALCGMRDARLVSICDTNEERLRAYAAQYGVAEAHTSYRRMLQNPEVDAVCVCTPDHLHRDMVIDALRAGRHVLCEKPLALHTDECRDMMTVAREQNRHLMVGQVCRLTPAFVKAKQMLDAGLIGELSFIESEYAHDYSHMGKCWRSDPAVMRHGVTGGGCHAVDLMRWMAGDPIEVFAYSNKKTLTDWPLDDTAVGVLKFKDGVIGKVFVSTGCKRAYTMRTLLYGTKGTIVVDNTSDTMSLFLGELGGTSELMGTKLKDIEMKIPVAIEKHNVRAELQLLCDVLLHGAQSALSAAQGAATVAVCEALIRSAATGKPCAPDYI